jgi:hypothetical protein
LRSSKAGTIQGSSSGSTQCSLSRNTTTL